MSGAADTTLPEEEFAALVERTEGHTPGPWEWEVLDHSMIQLVSRNASVPFADMSPVTTVSPCEACEGRNAKSGEWRWGCCTTISRADAALTEAAPALLAAYLAQRDRIRALEIELENVVGTDEHEFAGAGAAGLSHLRTMYRDKWEALGPSCRRSLRNSINNHVKRAVSSARQALAGKGGES